MSFRRVGGLNYSSKHNYVSSSNNATGNLLISENVGLPNTCIHFESNIDASFCGPTGPTGSSSSSGSSASSGATGPTGAPGAPGASGNIQSTIVNQTLRLVTIMPTPGTLPTLFMDYLIIPSAGTWLIIGNFNITYNIPYPATSTTTHGFWVSAFNLNYSDYQQLSAYSLAGGGGGLQRLFSVSSVYTTAAPITLGGYCGVVYSQYGATLSGNLTAVKIA